MVRPLGKSERESTLCHQFLYAGLLFTPIECDPEVFIYAFRRRGE